MDFETDEQQLDAIKQWWSKHGKSIVLTVLIIFIGQFIWHRYQIHQLAKRNNGAVIYMQLLNDLKQHDNKAIKQHATTLINDYDMTPYADIAYLALGKMSLDGGNTSAALAHYSNLIQHGHTKFFQAVGQINKARIELSSNAPDKALATVSTIYDPTYNGISEWIKAMAYTMKKQPSMAKTHFMLAKQSNALSSNALIHRIITVQQSSLNIDAR